MLENLTQRLGRVVKELRGEARLTESNIQDALREVRLALLEADVALPVVKELIASIREKALGQEVIGSLSPGQAMVGVVQRELTKLMGGGAATLNLATTPPAVILLAGLQGSGKTTTAVKLARLLIRNSAGHKLDALADHLGFEIPDRHRAASDARATVRVLLHLFEELGKHGVQTLAKARTFRLPPAPDPQPDAQLVLDV